MRLFLFLLLSYLLHPYSSFSQEYSYTHYDVKDGLAGSNVYSITQDKEGFIWMGTEAGVSRFDGTHFKNFTLEDGLPDIEVLQIFSDSRDRVWMGPFSKSICFYYKGKIHNQENDPLLKQVQLPGNILGFAEDKDGTILVGTRYAVCTISPDGQVRLYDNVDGHPLLCSAVATDKDGHFLVVDKSSIYKLSDGKFAHFLSLVLNDAGNPLFIGLNARMWPGEIALTHTRSCR